MEMMNINQTKPEQMEVLRQSNLLKSFLSAL